MFDKEDGRKAVDRIYETMLNKEDVAFWYEPWNGIDVLEAWAYHIDRDMLHGNETDIVAWLTCEFECDEVEPTDWFYDGATYTLAVALHTRYLEEHEVEE